MLWPMLRLRERGKQVCLSYSENGRKEKARALQDAQEKPEAVRSDANMDM